MLKYNCTFMRSALRALSFARFEEIEFFETIENSSQTYHKNFINYEVI